MQKLEINYGNSINIYEVASAQWKYSYDAKINLGKIELKLNVQDKDICLSFQLDNLRPNGIEVGLQSIIQKENIFALTKIFDVQEVSMRVEEISKSSLFIKLIFDENVISLWFDNEQIHSYNDRMQVLECIPTRYSYTANQMMNEYNNMLAKEFCEKYQYLILFEDSNQYINQYYESTFLGKVLIGYLIEEQAIIQMPKVHYIEDVVNLFLEQDTKLIQIMIDEDYCYYSYIPRYIELSNWMKLEIKDMGIYADALKQKAQPMAKKKKSWLPIVIVASISFFSSALAIIEDNQKKMQQDHFDETMIYGGDELSSEAKLRLSLLTPIFLKIILPILMVII